jgi:hypothetical protein
MENFTHIGLDVQKDTIAVATLRRTVDRDDGGHAELAQHLTQDERAGRSISPPAGNSDDAVRRNGPNARAVGLHPLGWQAERRL